MDESEEVNLTPNSLESIVRTELSTDDRIWIDVEPHRYEEYYDDTHAYKISRKMIILVRYELSHFQEQDGAIAFRHLVSRFTSEMR